MRIIKPGSYKPRWYRFACPRCGCVFEGQKHETKRVSANEVSVECPCCKMTGYVDVKELKKQVVKKED